MPWESEGPVGQPKTKIESPLFLTFCNLNKNDCYISSFCLLNAGCPGLAYCTNQRANLLSETLVAENGDVDKNSALVFTCGLGMAL